MWKAICRDRLQRLLMLLTSISVRYISTNWPFAAKSMTVRLGKRLQCFRERPSISGKTVTRNLQRGYSPPETIGCLLNIERIRYSGTEWSILHLPLNANQLLWCERCQTASWLRQTNRQQYSPDSTGISKKTTTLCLNTPLCTHTYVIPPACVDFTGPERQCDWQLAGIRWSCCCWRFLRANGALERHLEWHPHSTAESDTATDVTVKSRSHTHTDTHPQICIRSTKWLRYVW